MSRPNEMKALMFASYGGPEVLKLSTVAVPVIEKPNQALIKVSSSSVNPVDWKIRSGSMKALMKLKLPMATGLDYAGTVVEIGSEVKNAKVGDKVYGRLNPFGKSYWTGSYAEYMLVDTKSDTVGPIPPSVPETEAGGYGIAALTAYMSFVNGGVAAPPEFPTSKSTSRTVSETAPRVLVIGASGGVGHFAVQMGAHAFGCHVIGVCSERNAEYVRGLGAHQIVDYTKGSLASLLKEARVEENSLSIIMDFVGGDEYYTDLAKFLKPNGHFITAVGPFKHGGEAPVTFGEIMSFVWKIISRKSGYYIQSFIPGITPSCRNYSAITNLDNAAWPRIYEMIEKKLVSVTMQETFKLEDGAKSHEVSATGRVRGKVIVTV